MTEAAVYQFLGDLAEQHRRAGQLATRGALGGYDGGSINRLNYNWLPANRSADAEIAADGPLLRARARDLARNDALGIAAVDAWVRSVVGLGVPVFADVRGDDGEPLDELNDAIDDFFELAAAELDLDPSVHFYDQQRLAFSEVVEAGDALVLETENPNPQRLTPLVYQVLEIDYLDTTKQQGRGPDQNEIRRGIEFDVYGQPFAYYLWDRHPLDLQGGPTSPFSRPVPADAVIHLFWKLRPTQTAGVSWFAPVVKHLANLGGYVGAELSSARAQAAWAIAVKRAAGSGDGFGITGDDDEDAPEDAVGNSLADLGFPTIADLHADDDVKMLESSRPGSPHADAWLKFFLTLMANGARLSKQALTREAVGTFSGNKATRLSDQESIGPVCDWFGRNYAARIRDRVIARAMLEGRFARFVQPYEFKRDRRRWLRHLRPEPVLPWLEPNREVSAQLEAIDGGISDYSQAWGKLRIPWRKGMRRLAAQQAYADGIGLRLVRAPGATMVASDQGQATSDEELTPA